jgi:hypothetical protein
METVFIGILTSSAILLVRAGLEYESELACANRADLSDPLLFGAVKASAATVNQEECRAFAVGVKRVG